MRKLLTLLPFLFLSIIAVSQVHYYNLQSDPVIKREKSKSTSSKNHKTASVTLTLPFLEDFSGYRGIADTTKFIPNGGTYINNRYPVLPPTINVATFDGIDETGTAYEFSDDPFADGETDELESCDIDLSSLNTSNNVLMSFYWQKGGHLNDNSPDDNDSLVLQFKDNTGTWSNVWSELGDSVNYHGDTSFFQYVTVPFDSAKYFHNAFRFRFKSYGRRTGRYDVWNVDYIYIDQNRSSTDPYPELGFSTDPSSILMDYESMPYTHFLQAMNTFISDSVCATVYNQNTIIALLNDTLMQLNEDIRDVQIENTITTGGNVGLNTGETTEVCWTPSIDSLNNKLGPLDADSSHHLKYKLNINTGDIFRQNDSTVKTTKLDNYYAYDDGTVEGGAGIGKKFGRMVVEFDIAIDDTLVGVDILFPRQNEDLTPTGLRLMIFDELEGINGGTTNNILFQPTQSLTYGTRLNGFHRYAFYSNAVPVQAGKLYVGYEQFINDVIFVGLDGNTDNLDKVHIDINGTWIPFLNSTDSTKGSLMIRPVFDHYIVITAEEQLMEKLDVSVFPNPASDLINTSIGVDQLFIYNVMGQPTTSFQGNDLKEFNISELEPGTYIIKMLKGDRIATRKIVIH